MYFLEELRNITKPIKGTAGLGNSSCVMPFYTTQWKQILVCETDGWFRRYIDSLPYEKRKNYRIINNNPD